MPEPIKLPEPDLTMLSGPDYYTADTVRRLIAEARAEEREACARVCDGAADMGSVNLRLMRNRLASALLDAPQPQAEPVNAELLAALRQCVAALDALHAPGDSIYTRASDAADRAIARAEAAKPQGLTKEQIADGYVESNAEGWWENFTAGVRFAERAHGITGDDQ